MSSTTKGGSVNIIVHSTTAMEKKTIKVKKTVMVPVEQEVEQEVLVPAVIGGLRVYPVQYRNYPHTIHIQHRGESRNRGYGFAFDIPGQATHDVKERFLPSLAGTDQVYANGTLTVNGTEAWLIGINQYVYAVPMSCLPAGV